MEEGYQETLAVLEEIRRFNNTRSIRIVNLAVDFLIDAQNFFEVNQTLIDDLLEFLMIHQKDDGTFWYDESSDPRSEIGKIKNQAIFTAQIISTIIKEENYAARYKNKISKSLKYLEKIDSFKVDYEKVLAAYTFALVENINNTKKALEKMNNAYNISNFIRHKSAFVEIASYKILTKIMLEDDPREEVKWLINQRSSSGGFISPYDTVLALKALLNYSRFRKIETNSIAVSVDNKLITEIAWNDKFTSKEFDLSRNSHEISIRGDGLAFFSVYYEYDEKENMNDNFEISAKVSKESLNELHLKIDIKAKDKTNLAVIEVELPRGFVYLSYENKNEVKVIG